MAQESGWVEATGLDRTLTVQEEEIIISLMTATRRYVDDGGMTRTEFDAVQRQIWIDAEAGGGRESVERIAREICPSNPSGQTRQFLSY